MEAGTNREIGDELDLAEKTIKDYVSSILSKLASAAELKPAPISRRESTSGSWGVSEFSHLGRD